MKGKQLFLSQDQIDDLIRTTEELGTIINQVDTLSKWYKDESLGKKFKHLSTDLQGPVNRLKELAYYLNFNERMGG